MEICMRKLDDWLYIASIAATLYFFYRAFFVHDLFTGEFWFSMGLMIFYVLCTWAWFYESSFYEMAEEDT